MTIRIFCDIIVFIHCFQIMFVRFEDVVPRANETKAHHEINFKHGRIHNFFKIIIIRHHAKHFSLYTVLLYVFHDTVNQTSIHRCTWRICLNIICYLETTKTYQFRSMAQRVRKIETCWYFWRVVVQPIKKKVDEN